MLPEKEMQPYGGYVDIQKTAASGQETFASKIEVPRVSSCTAQGVQRNFGG